MRFRKATLLVVLALTGTVGGTAMAQSPAPVSDATLQELIQRLDAQEAELRELRSLLNREGAWTSIDDGSAADSAAEVSLKEAESDGYAPSLVGEPEGVDVYEEKFSVDMGGRIMWDATYGTDDGLADIPTIGRSFQNGHEFRRVRLFLDGEGYGIFNYKLQIDFAEFNDPVAKDVYLGAEFPVGQFRVGHFKEPFSLEELTSSKYITFLERSLPNAMVPARSMGMQLWDNYAGDRGYWAVGTFWDDLQQTPADDDGDVDNQDQEFRSFNARATYLPVYQADGRYLVHVGGAFRHVEVEDPALRFRARPEIHDTFRVLGVAPGAGTDTYQQYGIELASVWGPASVQSEYIITDFQNGTEPSIDGFYVFGSYFLTGENRAYSKSSGAFSRVYPLENFWWVDSCNPDCRHGLGAWELAARYSTLDWDDSGLTADGGARGELDNFTFGVNWYWTPYMRVMFNYVHSEVDDADTGRDADIDAFLTRFQVDF